MQRAASAAKGRRGVFAVDEDPALAELELAWADSGFGVDGDSWPAVSSAGDVLTGQTPDALDREIRAHRQAGAGR
jgi:hypothetical protein